MSWTQPAANPWADEAVVDALRELHAKGVSCSQIAKTLNKQFRLGLTRNAIIGKLSRLSLRRDAPSAPRAAPRAAKPAPAPKPVAPKLPPTPKAQPVTAREPESIATARPFGDREIGQCWWPIGEGETMLSCCAPIARGGLCAEHAERGYQRPATNIDRKRAASSFLYHAGRTQQGHVIGKRGGALAE